MQLKFSRKDGSQQCHKGTERSDYKNNDPNPQQSFQIHTSAAIDVIPGDRWEPEPLRLFPEQRGFKDKQIHIKIF